MIKPNSVSLEDWCIKNNKDHIRHVLNIEDAKTYSHASTKIIDWKCDKGHIFKEAIIAKTHLKNFSCPICTGHRVLKGYNDLASQCPEIAKDWDYANNKFKPDEVTVGSSKYANYNMRISARTYTNQGGIHTTNALKKFWFANQDADFFIARFDYKDTTLYMDLFAKQLS